MLTAVWSLFDTARVEASPLYNHDLAPVPLSLRTWTTYNFAALWVSMAHSIPTYVLASGLMASGMSWSQALVTILLGNLIVLIPILLNSHPGRRSHGRIDRGRSTARPMGTTSRPEQTSPTSCNPAGETW